ncbi:hypothetical protein V6N12_035146 [Hibiscus sabdariffa]|uniref:Uncharacterized protein n=1 Tax=Hibiscus sabdariffa TaxID=183260 RepID=A0ABR2AKB9_9ROSI
MKGRLETEFDVDSSSEDDKDSEVGKRGKNMVEEDDSNWPLDYFEQHSIRNVGNTQLEDFQRAREGNPFQVYQNAKDRLPPRAGNLQALSLLKMMETYTQSGSLNFDASKTLMSDPKKLLKERDGYVEWITQFLKLHRDGNIDELRVYFDLNLQHRRPIDRWIKIALMKKVKSLELDLNHADQIMGGTVEITSLDVNFSVHLELDLKYVPQLCDVSYAGQWESRRVFELRESIPSCLVTSQSVNLSLRIPFLPIVIS